jgi:hypothetical protein
VVEDIGVVVVRACVIGLPRATVLRGSPITGPNLGLLYISLAKDIEEDGMLYGRLGY